MLIKVYQLAGKLKGILIGLAMSLLFFVYKASAQLKPIYDDIGGSDSQAAYGPPGYFYQESISEAIIKKFWLPIVVAVVFIIGSTIFFIKRKSRQNAQKNSQNRPT